MPASARRSGPQQDAGDRSTLSEEPQKTWSRRTSEPARAHRRVGIGLLGSSWRSRRPSPPCHAGVRRGRLHDGGRPARKRGGRFHGSGKDLYIVSPTIWPPRGSDLGGQYEAQNGAGQRGAQGVQRAEKKAVVHEPAVTLDCRAEDVRGAAEARARPRLGPCVLCKRLRLGSRAPSETGGGTEALLAVSAVPATRSLQCRRVRR